MNPTVNIHIVTYNSEAYIVDCLEAVFNQSYPIKEIIVVDNASTDGTRELLTRCDQRITAIFNYLNTGFAPAHNHAINLSSSDYLHQDYLKSLIGYAVQHSEVGSLTGKLLLKSSPHLVDSTGLVINKQRRAFDRGSNEPADQWLQSAEIFGVSGAAALYSKRMIDDVSIMDQFYDEDFFAYKEVVDVAWRSELLGWKSYYVSSATAYHERGWKQGSRTQQPLFVRKYSYINRYKMILKNESALYALMHIFPFLFY